ncbi:MAG: hypothetical protein CMO55_25515 [Verrucomicrobiales bacterium]|nr:hypothetical protein [Verrucomicrobiales bacterium]
MIPKRRYHKTKSPLIYALILAFAGTGMVKTATAIDWTQSRNADKVLGQIDYDTDGSGLSEQNFNYPNSVAICPLTNKVFVCDTGNHRILRFASYEAMFTGAKAEAVFGSSNFVSVNAGTTAQRFADPLGIFVDQEGRLWVCDSTNARVLRFDDAANKSNFPAADGVLGQTLLTTNASPGTPSANSLDSPSACVVESNGTLWVADSSDHRILRYDGAALKSNGGGADGVLGQSMMDTSASGSGTNGVSGPTALAVSNNGTLWVADYGNRRVLRFNSAVSKSNGADADGVLGQTGLFGNGFYGFADNAATTVIGLAWSPVNDTLYVSDNSYNRILIFEFASTKTGLISADTFIGNNVLGSMSAATGQNRSDAPRMMCVDTSNRLWLADTGNNRVLRYSPDSAAASPDIQPDLTVGEKLGKQKGDGIYNSVGAGQKGKVKVIGRKKARLFVIQQNDGRTTNPFILAGSRKNKLFKVKYISLNGLVGNVTGNMLLGTFETADLEPGQTHIMRVDIKATPKAKSRTAKYKGFVRSRDPNASTTELIKTFVKAKPKK